MELLYKINRIKIADAQSTIDGGQGSVMRNKGSFFDVYFSHILIHISSLDILRLICMC